MRAASFRGVFRYWLRAILGSVIQDIKVLHAQESALFGSTDKGSRVRVIAFTPGIKPQKDLYVLPKQLRNNQNKLIEYSQHGYPAGSTIMLELRTHPLDNLPEELGELIRETIELAFALGGFGRRARRLGGNLEIVSTGGVPFSTPMDGEAWKTYLQKLVRSACDRAAKITGKPLTKVSSTPRFPCFASEYYSILIDPQTYNDLDDVYDHLWSASKWRCGMLTEGRLWGKPSAS